MLTAGHIPLPATGTKVTKHRVESGKYSLVVILNDTEKGTWLPKSLGTLLGAYMLSNISVHAHMCHPLSFNYRRWACNALPPLLYSQLPDYKTRLWLSAFC